jgi:hypothetical protein
VLNIPQINTSSASAKIAGTTTLLRNVSVLPIKLPASIKLPGVAASESIGAKSESGSNRVKNFM